jgi:hypothetical protein
MCGVRELLIAGSFMTYSRKAKCSLLADCTRVRWSVDICVIEWTEDDFFAFQNDSDLEGMEASYSYYLPVLSIDVPDLKRISKAYPIKNTSCPMQVD